MYNHLKDESGNPLTHLQQLLGEELIELLPEISVLFLRKTIPLLTNITYALQVNNFKQLNQSAMELKTFARQLGFERLTYYAVRLENNSLLKDRDTAVINLQQLQIEHQRLSKQLQKDI